MKTPKPVTIDFETKGIDGRPAYPPEPVGVSIKYPVGKPRYYAWGHALDNNCTKAEALVALREAWKFGVTHKQGLLFQNGKFDIDVAATHLGLKQPPWELIHDTMFLLFLDDPNQQDLGLKPSAERLLGMAPDEQDAVADWLITHQPVPGVKISKSKSSDHYFGRYIWLAPGTLVGKYANGDTDRTWKLFKLLYPKIVREGMLPAYERERELMPNLLDMERQGIPIAVKKLESDVGMYGEWLEHIDWWVRKTLCIKDGQEINLDSGEQLVNAMVAAGKADPDLIPRTKTGKFQSNKEALLVGVTDKVLLAVLKYRTQLQTCYRTFMVPWLATAKASGGFIYTSWNQVKAPRGDHTAGARTGRLSSHPNFQNIPKLFKAIFWHQDPDPKNKLAKLPASLKGLPDLPQMRSYIMPFDGDVLIDRDYSQQEPRILAHFEGEALLAAYTANPWIDFHDHAKSELELRGRFYERTPVKNTNLGIIYGMGVGTLAEKNDMSVKESKSLKDAVSKLYPGLRDMYKDMKRRAAEDEPLRTWGGRLYYCEPPKMIDGRLRRFDYKMVNALIQGSAADCTKEAINRYYRAKPKKHKLLLNVHDQLVASVPKAEKSPAMQLLRKAMESIEFDVPMLTEGDICPDDWGTKVPYDKKGALV